MRHQPLGCAEQPDERRRMPAWLRLGPIARRLDRRPGANAPDPAAIVPAAKVDRSARRLGHELGMLDQLAIHVDDIERPVRPSRQIDRPERWVRRGEELPSLLDAPGNERHAGRLEHAAMHQVRQGLAHERIALIRLGQAIRRAR